LAALGQMISGRFITSAAQTPLGLVPRLSSRPRRTRSPIPSSCWRRVRLSCSCVRRTVVRLMLLLRSTLFATYVGNAWRSVTIITAILGVEVSICDLSLSTLGQLVATSTKRTRYSLMRPSWQSWSSQERRQRWLPQKNETHQ
jgi:hypothetical protein